jgi:outer membrane receptor protein involved in Fe transport
VIAPSLGRNLAACGAAATCNATATITVLEPTSQFEPRYTLVDLRLSRTIGIGRLRLQPRIDVYNLFNAATVLSQNTRLGATFRQPLEIVAARFVKVGVQVDF